MGSTSSGKFKDYPPSKGKKQKDEGGSGGHDSSGSSDRGLGREDQCTRDLVNVALEEVGRSAYFQAHTTPNRRYNSSLESRAGWP